MDNKKILEITTGVFDDSKNKPQITIIDFINSEMSFQDLACAFLPCSYLFNNINTLIGVSVVFNSDEFENIGTIKQIINYWVSKDCWINYRNYKKIDKTFTFHAKVLVDTKLDLEKIKHKIKHVTISHSYQISRVEKIKFENTLYDKEKEKKRKNFLHDKLNILNHHILNVNIDIK